MNFSKACSYTFISMENYNHVNSVTSFLLFETLNSENPPAVSAILPWVSRRDDSGSCCRIVQPSINLFCVALTVLLSILQSFAVFRWPVFSCPFTHASQ